MAERLTALGGAALVLATVTNAKAMSAVIDGLGVGGKLLVVGASPEPIEVSPFQLIGQRRSIQGWPSGVAADSEDTLAFSALSGVRPMIETYPARARRRSLRPHDERRGAVPGGAGDGEVTARRRQLAGILVVGLYPGRQLDPGMAAAVVDRVPRAEGNPDRRRPPTATATPDCS